MTPFDWGLLGAGIGGLLVIGVGGYLIYRVAKTIIDEWNDTH